MNILFCTDGSKISYNSIKNFSHWIKECTVDILCVIDLSFLPETIEVEDSGFGARCANSADSILDYSEKLLNEYGIKTGEKIKMCGSTVDSILEVMCNSKYDYVVLGSHGKRGIQKWLGSVSQEVASSSGISTYISKDKREYQKILFTLDSAEISSGVVSKCLEDLNIEDKEIYLVTVYEIPDYLFLEGNIDSNWILEIEKKQEKAGMLLLNQFEKMFNKKGINITGKTILSGVPAQEIIKYAAKENIDLIVSGIRDKKPFSKLLLGSVSKRVLENTKSDVLIVRN